MALPSGHRPRLLRVVFVVAFLLQSAALYWPVAPGTGQGLPLDKVAHLLLFAIVAFTGTAAGIPVRWLVAVLAAQALISEAAHHWLYMGRGGEISDLVADVLGAAAGIALGTRWRRHRRALQVDNQ